ncbi:MAG: hypothetical protein HYZ81_06070 [Nitrospinae bacterium]|nr:hypothetical protein [Nitrospinota bacterium]
MRKDERDRMMRSMSEEQRADFRRIVRELRSQRQASSGGQRTIRELVESGKVAAPSHLRHVMEALMERDDMGPKAGQPAPDFSLKRLESEARVRLSSFQGKQPVAVVFGSYT